MPGRLMSSSRTSGGGVPQVAQRLPRRCRTTPMQRKPEGAVDEQSQAFLARRIVFDDGDPDRIGLSSF